MRSEKRSWKIIRTDAFRTDWNADEPGCSASLRRPAGSDHSGTYTNSADSIYIVIPNFF